MNYTDRSRYRRLVLVAVTVSAFGLPAAALADNVHITYSAAGQTAPDFTSICANTTTCQYGMEDFSGWNGRSNYTTHFSDAGTGSSDFKGVYSAGAGTTTGSGGEWVSLPQNQYGGDPKGIYPELYGSGVVGGSNTVSSYVLTLTSNEVPGVNYFGIWISALDLNNDLKLYDGSTLIADLNTADLLADLGSCNSGTSNPYCGNPISQFKGQDSGEPFVYVNVFDLNGYITKVEFDNSGSTGFESTNHAVAYVNAIHPTGTPVTPMPEPASAAVLGVGLLGLAVVGSRRRKA